jgi:hypothetical protein
MGRRVGPPTVMVVSGGSGTELGVEAGAEVSVRYCSGERGQADER